MQGGVKMEFILFFDWVSLLFFRVVSLISSSVFLFRKRYIKADKQLRLFVVLVLMFVLRIFFMVFRLNLVRLILGWDGLGLISYILVVYYQNEKSNAAGILTALSNRVGDAALIIVIARMLEYGS